MNRVGPRSTNWLLVLVATLAFVPMSLPAAGDAGRDYSRCIHACNAVRQACGDRCDADCRALFAPGTGSSAACISECKDRCLEANRECRSVCKAIKNGVTPDEPS